MTLNLPPDAQRAAPLPRGEAVGVQDGGRRILLVAGMHRSGTSALARVLNLLGAEIPGPVVAGDLGNTPGHWEPQAVVDLHDAMLKSAHTNVNSVFAVPDAWFAGSEAESFVRRLRDLLAGPLASGALHVVKDPRLALFIPVWRQALEGLGVEPLVVLPFRHPVEVAASLRLRQGRHYPDTVWPLGRGVLLWLRYVLTAEAASRGMRRAFVSYDALLDDWRRETQRLRIQLGLRWPRRESETGAEVDAFLSREHKHADRRAMPDDDIPLAREVLDLLTAAVGRPVGDPVAFDGARARLDAACALFHDYVEALELRLGETPSLRTEFVDFLRRYGGSADEGASSGVTAELDAAEGEADPARRAALLASARMRLEVLAAERAELETLNAALMGAARHTAILHADELAAARQAQAGAEAAARDGAEASERARADLAAAAEAVFARVERSEAELRTLQARLEAELAEARARADAADARVPLLAEELAQADATLAAIMAERDAALDEARSQRAQQESILRSTSWKLTAPLRALVLPFRQPKPRRTTAPSPPLSQAHSAEPSPPGDPSA